MEQQFPMAFQVALYAVSGTIVVLAAVVAYALSRLDKKLDRLVAAAERFEAEVTPLARETREVVGRMRDMTELAQHQWLAIEDLIGAVGQWTHRTQRVVGVAGGLVLSPVVAFNRTARIMQAGVGTFLRTLWTGRRQSRQKAKAS
jgi:hypothetical protein